MDPKLFTFHKILSACEEGSYDGWLAFLSDYTPVVFQLVDIYRPSSTQSGEDFWREALIELAARNFARLRGFEHQAEREFVIEFRAFLLEWGAGKLDAARDSTAAPRPTPELVMAWLEGLPLIHQEVLFLKLAGYSDATLEKMLVITPAVAQKGLERLRPDYTALVGSADDRCLWPAAWAEVLRFARAARKDNCPPLRQFVRIQEGAFSWYDKEPSEQHIGACLHCLERWTALRETKHWRRAAKPLPAGELERFVSSLPLGAGSKPRRSLWTRMFGSWIRKIKSEVSNLKSQT